LKTSPGLLCQRVELRYAFIAEHQPTWPVAVLCEVREVSRSGLYAYRPRHARVEIAAKAVVLFARIKALAADTRHSDGTRVWPNNSRTRGALWDERRRDG
jgi:hypothetical protein